MAGNYGHGNYQILPNQYFDSNLAFYWELEAESNQWLNNLQFTWNLWKKSQVISKLLIEYFTSLPNPYLCFLRVLVNAKEFMNPKNMKSSLSYVMMEEFSRWINTCKHMYPDCLDNDLKLAGFRLLSMQKNMHLTKLFSVVYEFENSKEIFIPLIEDMLKKKKYKDASYFIEMLKMQPLYQDPKILLFPLILQNKLTIVSEFLAGHPDIQKQLVKFLDDLVAPNVHFHFQINTLIEELDVPEVLMSTLQAKPMTKLIAKLAKTYDLPPEACPNVNQRRGEGALQFLVNKRYNDGSLSAESFREMAKEAVGQHENLQQDLVKFLVNYNAVPEALYFANFYNIPRSKWPYNLANADPEDFKKADTADCWDTEIDEISYHTLKLPRECIKIIDDYRSFDEFLDEGLRGVTIVGIDSEWKPSFGTKKTELALIQIATETNVYILDVTTMGSTLQENWATLCFLLFDNRNILKLGFGIASDIEMMRESLPAFKNIRACGQGYIDLLHVWRKLVEDPSFEFPFVGDPAFVHEGLSKLVEITLGNRLNKSNQFSNWQNRPLREGQITYAALDAYCLLEVYGTLANQCARFDIPFFEICEGIQHIAHKSPKNKVLSKPSSSNGGHSGGYTAVPATESNVQKAVPVITPVPAHQWRVICDSTFGELAKHLRMCGCDCVHMNFDQDGQETAQTALRESRIILTSAVDLEKFSRLVGKENCFEIQGWYTEEQLKEVLTHFKIVVTQRDIFSRCLECNEDEFVFVSTKDMFDLIRRFGNKKMSDIVLESQNAQTPRLDRSWRLNFDSVSDDGITKYGIKIPVERVYPKVLRSVPCFYVCEKCGRTYWDNSQLELKMNEILKTLEIQG